ncbi:MAG: Altered inheritance of mitochondria protein 6 [Geoglossum umbratile]|nr:MAG: Altered inheritance of mitochondria protein 6 [Geoglossum umbratile]
MSHSSTWAGLNEGGIEGEHLLAPRYDGDDFDEELDVIALVQAPRERPVPDDDMPRGSLRNVSSWSWRQMFVNMMLRRAQKRGDILGVAESVAMLEKRGLGRRRMVVRYCCMGAFVVLVALALISLVSMIMSLVTLVWANDIQQVIADWGKHGKVGEGLSWWPTSFSRDITPIPCHSHNDYWRRVPLYSALRQGFISVEADVWLFDNELYVGHDTSSLTRNRTLNSLYINPLVDILTKQNPSTEFTDNNTRNGVFDTDPGQSLVLLIDLKTNGQETWPHVIAQLEPLRKRNWLTVFDGTTIVPGPITVVGTGNTPFNLVVANQTYRDAFFDAPLDTMWEDPGTLVSNLMTWDVNGMAEDEKFDGRPFQLPPSRKRSTSDGEATPIAPLSDTYNTTNSYYASASFGDTVGRVWRGHLSDEQLNIIRGQIQGAHRRGLKVRYWDLPSWPIGKRNRVWNILVREGIDILNVDDLRAASGGLWG